MFSKNPRPGDAVGLLLAELNVLEGTRLGKWLKLALILLLLVPGREDVCVSVRGISSSMPCKNTSSTNIFSTVSAERAVFNPDRAGEAGAVPVLVPAVLVARIINIPLGLRSKS